MRMYHCTKCHHEQNKPAYTYSSSVRCHKCFSTKYIWAMFAYRLSLK